MPRCELSTSLRWISTFTALACATLSPGVLAYESPFATAVMRTSPIAYFHFETRDAKSGTQSLQARGPVRIDSPGMDPASQANSFARLNGRGAFFETTQRGGIGRAGSMMAWVNLDKLPSQAGRILYVAGISQNGNDFDLQFEGDNALHFYTAGGSNIRFSPDMGSLVGSWHMVVATFDVDAHTRALYWDGALVASDADAGKPGKTGEFTIGASVVWAGRFFEGGIDEVALWSKSLTANQVTNFYAAASQGAPTAQAVTPTPAPAVAFTTTAQVEIEDAQGKIPLRSEEKVAVMFLSAIQSIELDCQLRAGSACTMDQMVGRLKYDPAGDPNYTYAVKVNGKAWEAHADPKRQGLGGFYFMARVMSPDAYYNPNGPAGPMDRQLTSRSISGESFSVR